MPTSTLIKDGGSKPPPYALSPILGRGGYYPPEKAFVYISNRVDVGIDPYIKNQGEL